MDGWTDEWMDGRTRANLNPPPTLKWGHKKITILFTVLNVFCKDLNFCFCQISQSFDYSTEEYLDVFISSDHSMLKVSYLDRPLSVSIPSSREQLLSLNNILNLIANVYESLQGRFLLEALPRLWYSCYIIKNYTNL